METRAGFLTLQGTHHIAWIICEANECVRRAVETVYHPDTDKSGTVQMPEVTAVIKAMQNSPSAAYVRECSFSERLVLAALVKVGKREGVGELKWGDVGAHRRHWMRTYHAVDHTTVYDSL